MAKNWTPEHAQQFWNGRDCYLLMKGINIEDKRQKLIEEEKRRSKLLEEEMERFLLDNECSLNKSEGLSSLRGKNISQDLKFWIENCSWNYCDNCHSLDRENLFPRYNNRVTVKHIKKCKCTVNRYIVPHFDLIPLALVHLSFSDLCVLRPLDFHCGDYVRQLHGYRQKTGMCRVTWSKETVESKIHGMDDVVARRRCKRAYNFLMGFKESSYRFFIDKHLQHMSSANPLNLYDLGNCKGIECSLWPNLYPYTAWCESIITGNESRMSGKISFMTKVLSSIVDYSVQYELLQYHYDVWIFKTVGGAINSARRMKCSPARSLNAKVFNSGYWKKQHRLLIDAVRQFGYPSVFITINPYEWSFPFPKWVENARHVTGCGPTNLAGFETIHIAHTLSQLVRGYLCGSNSNKWSSHVFNYNNIAGMSNINTYFYRFEFQERGTVHLHLLVWIKNINYIQHDLIRADIPYQDPEIAFLARKLQPADQGCLPMNEEPTRVDSHSKILSIHHPHDAFVLNLRAYISTLLPAVSCRMDFQVTDGKSMILRYVTSYVSKWKDAYCDNALYSTHLCAYQAAYRHLRDLQPCEPEMWLQLSAIKLAWSQSRTKDFVVPFSSCVADNSVYVKYTCRPADIDNLSMLEWLRYVNHVPAIPKPYMGGNTLVALKMASPFSDEYFFQYLLMCHPHRSVTTLFHPQHEQLPVHIRFFVSAVTMYPSLWQNESAVKDYFEKECHRYYYIDTLISHVSSLHDVWHMWRRQILTSDDFLSVRQLSATLELDNFQTAIVCHIMNCIENRDQCLESAVQWYDDCSSEEGEESEEEEEEEEQYAFRRSTRPSDFRECDWRKFIMITGKAGTGKSQVLKDVINKCIDQQRNILVACPTGILAGHYRDLYQGDINCDTVHSAFSFPVRLDEQPRVNWNIGTYDVVIIEELSMIPKRIMHHVIRTISEVTVRPLVIMAGDNRQQQPIETVDRKTVIVDNIFQDKAFNSLVHHFQLVKQYRVIYIEYQRFLDHIRYWKPSQKLLDDIQKGNVVCTEGEPTDEDLLQQFIENPDANILTVSRRACTRVNNIVINSIFTERNALATVQCDFHTEPISIYKNMRVVITQNRDKTNNVVNGQEAIVHCVHNATVFLKLPNGKIVNVYPVRKVDEQNRSLTCYPFSPCYALTMCKSQGQNLKKVILWFDGNNVAPGTAYVSLSRIKRREDLVLVTPMVSRHARPVRSDFL